jgi:predicted dehydrogenase
VSKILRVGIVGLGVMGNNHARVVSESANLELIGVVDPLTEFSARFEHNKLLMTLEHLIELEPDYCVISAPTAYHKDIALELFRKNINVLIEKPLAHNLEAATEILESSKNSLSKVAVGHIERFNSAAQLAKIKIQSGLLGEIYQVLTSRQGPFPSRIADVGVILDLATHDIDLISWLLEKKYKSIAANVARKTGRLNEDLVVITATLENDVIVNHVVNWLSPFKERNIMILGEHGALKIDTLNSDLVFYENGTSFTDQSSISHFHGVTQGQEVKFAFYKPEPLKIEHLNFEKHLMGHESSIVTIEEAYEVVRVAKAIGKSAEEKKVVHL